MLLSYKDDGKLCFKDGLKDRILEEILLGECDRSYDGNILDSDVG